MTFLQYLNTLITMVKRNPEIEDYEVIYSADDEGNSYHKVVFTPTVMKSKGLENSYIEADSVKDTREGDVICIN